MKSFWRKIIFVQIVFLIFLEPVFSKRKKTDSSSSEKEIAQSQIENAENSESGLDSDSSETSSASGNTEFSEVSSSFENSLISENLEDDSEGGESQNLGADEIFVSETTRLAPPAKKDKSFFASVSPEILSEVYNGSSESLKAAVSSLKHAEESSLPEKILFSVSISMMKILWPSVSFDENPIEVSEDNSYTAAVNSAKNGMYDFNTGNSDFLTCALPSLVLAVSDSRSDYYSESEQNLKKCLDEKPASVFVNYLYALLCRRQKRYSEALEHLKNAEENSPESEEIMYALSEVYYETKNYSDAEILSESLLEKNPSNRNYLKLCANTSFANGKLEKAEQYVNRVLQTEPGNSAFMLFRTKILVARKEYIRAASLLDAYSRIDSSSRDYLFLRFTVQKEWNKNITAATSTIQKALELYPEDDEIVLAAADLASENNESINGWSGEELASQILEKDPENYEARKIKIKSMMQSENWDAAYSESSKLLQNPAAAYSVSSSSSGGNDAVFTHVKICIEAGKKNEAWKIASELYSRNPSDENVLQCYIEVLVSTSRKSEASKIIGQLLPSASSKMKSFLYYEKSYLSVSEENILSDLRSSLTANPRNKDALLRLYEIYFGKKEYRKAQYYLKQVVSISPKDEKLLELNRQLESLIR